MQTTRFSTLIATILLMTAGITGQAQSPENLAKMGRLNRAKDGYVALYNQGRTGEPDFFYNFGKLYLNLNLPDSAAFYFQKGIEVDKTNPMNYVGLARYYYLKNDSIQAKSRLKTASQLSRNSPAYNIGMAELYLQPQPNRPDLAEKFLLKAQDQKGMRPQAHILRGDHYLEQGQAGDASNEYKQAIYFDKNNPIPYFKAGIVYSKGRIWLEAINSMKKAIECDSTFAPAYRELGETYLRFDKYHLARESYDKYMTLVEPDVRDQIRYASILVLDRDFEAASKIINKLVAENVQDPKLLRIQAYCDFENGKYETGLASIRNFFEKASPDEPIASDYEYYAQLLMKNNLDSLAVPQYLKAIEIDTTRRVLYEQIAKIYEKKKDVRNAAKYYELNLVNKEQPTQVDYFKIGYLYYGVASSRDTTMDTIQRAQNIEDASRLFTKVYELSPTNYLGYFWQARTQSLKDPETSVGLAKPYYEKALSIMDTTANQTKLKSNIAESRKYLGYYHYLRFEDASIKADKTQIAAYRDSALTYWNKIVEADPADTKAMEAIKALKKK
ncbi:MAG: tetratricopeptide repeat protein [Bacteroidales bacterium]|nr:tetratricopeptide repeat protein [Bacteroidales bacterium]